MQERKLDAILVLRIQDGNDIFLSISGSYVPSFYGLSLSVLSAQSRCEPLLILFVYSSSVQTLDLSACLQFMQCAPPHLSTLKTVAPNRLLVGKP